jgi:hypothetical protein
VEKEVVKAVVHKLGYYYEDDYFLTKCETRGEKYLDPRVAKDWSFVTCKLCKRAGKDYQLWLKDKNKKKLLKDLRN